MNSLLRLATLALSLAALSCAGGAEKEKGADVPPAPEDTSARWGDIKNITFDERTRFATGLQRLEARVDEQISELTARRSAMTATDYTKDWDFAMKILVNARSYLRGMGEEAAKSTPENWDQSKDRVGRAWVQTQEAYAKVKTSTTNRG
jgi:hypothetical protein